MKAIGTYVRELRLAHGLTQNEVAIAAGTNVVYIYRIEEGKLKNPGADLLLRVVDAVKGSGDHVMKLLLADSPTDDEARRLAAEAQLTPEEREQLRFVFESDAETRELLEAVYRVSANPATRERIRGYLDGLGGAAPAPAPPRTSPRRRRG